MGRRTQHVMGLEEQDEAKKRWLAWRAETGRRRQELLATPQTDPVRENCRQRRYADHVILGGLDGLVERWEERVASIADSERLGYLVEEYCNDLAGRRILWEVLPLATEEQRQAVTGRI